MDLFAFDGKKGTKGEKRGAGELNISFVFTSSLSGTHVGGSCSPTECVVQGFDSKPVNKKNVR